jgi:hypothetical protein
MAFGAFENFCVVNVFVGLSEWLAHGIATNVRANQQIDAATRALLIFISWRIVIRELSCV